MPCDTLFRLREAERRAEEERRELALAQLEQDLASGIAQLQVNADGSVIILGTLPQGMHDSCVLAALQRRGSVAFTAACEIAGVYGTDFITLHGHSHSHGH